jgi:predicted AlkP superfamily pyrophosphatase or phosphodiesterase
VSKHRLQCLRTIYYLLVSLVVLITGCHPSKTKINDKAQVILISIDALRSDHLTPFGYPRNTSPNIEKLVRDAQYYPNGYPNGCWTIPSHMSLLTGTLPSRHRMTKDWKSVQKKQYFKLNESLLNIGEVLKRFKPDLQTIKFAALPDEVGFGRGFDLNHRMDPLSEHKIHKFLEVLEKNRDNEFFIFIHT